MIKFVEWKTLHTRSSVDQGPQLPVEGSLLVGLEIALDYHEHQCEQGYDYSALYPAFHQGIRCWLKRSIWCSTGGYSASGIVDEIIDFADGVKVFLEQGVFSFPALKEHS